MNPNRSFQTTTWKAKLLVGVTLGWFFLLILLPLFSIVREILHSEWRQVWSALTSPEALHAFQLTLIICIFAVFINTLFGVVMAIVLARHQFKGKLLLESLLDLPFAISPVVIGLMLIILFGSTGWIGRLFQILDIKVIYALPGMVIATLFVTVPFTVKEITPLLRQFGHDQEEAAAILGASEWQIFWKVTLPTIKWGMGYGIVLTLARSIGEFGAILVVSGSIINKTQSATIHIHHQFTDFNYIGAFSASLLLIIVSLILINFIHIFSKKRRWEA